MVVIVAAIVIAVVVVVLGVVVALVDPRMKRVWLLLSFEDPSTRFMHEWTRS